MCPRIYAECLASRNNGKMHGKWIDAAQSAEEIQNEINGMLAASPEPSAEEYEIVDSEGFDPFTRVTGETLETISKLGELVEEHGEAIAAYYWNDVSIDLEDLEGSFLDDYVGGFDSFEDYAEHYIEDTGVLIDVPDSLKQYFDVAKFARDLRHDFWVHDSVGTFHVFRNS